VGSVVLEAQDAPGPLTLDPGGKPILAVPRLEGRERGPARQRRARGLRGVIRKRRR
jgi:hypothetical protein